MYSGTHLGHARCYVVFDTIRRILEKRHGLDVEYIMNVTDIDDKIIKASLEQGVEAKEIARRWEADFFDNMEILGVKMPSRVTRVSEYVEDIIEYVETILGNGFAYFSENDGCVYFDVKKFIDEGFQYCKLVPTRLEEIEEEVAGVIKKNRADFVLWKKAKENEPSWESPWGRGRPGWHIECSAMIHASFGKTSVLDIHSGGSDLKFPHHDNEIAQCEAHGLSHEKIKCFIHCAPLTISGQKMSKSLKNFITVEEALRVVSPRQIRLMFMMRRFTSPMNIDPDHSFDSIRKIDSKIKNFLFFLKSKSRITNSSRLRDSVIDRRIEDSIDGVRRDFFHKIDNNFDTQASIELLLDLMEKSSGYVSSDDSNPVVLNRLYSFFADSFETLSLNYRDESLEVSSEDTNKMIDMIVSYRSNILTSTRKGDLKDVFRVSDVLRDEKLKEMGIRVEDGKEGWRWMDAYEKHMHHLNSREKEEFDIHRNRDSEEERDEGELGGEVFCDKIVDEGADGGKFGDLWKDKKYLKFRIGTIGDDGIPTSDVDGKLYPPKVIDRFKKDLERYEIESQKRKNLK